MKPTEDKEARLTDVEMAEVNGDKEACWAILKAFDTCEGCSADCRKVADAQLAKLEHLGYHKD